MMKDRVAATDWAQTALGPRTAWPAALHHAVEMMLDAHAQIVIFAGPDCVALYNDAYAPTIGRKHPAAFGQPAHLFWPELWDMLGPMLAQVRESGKTLSARDRAFVINRHGYDETVFFDISYSPLRDAAGACCAVLCIVAETTQSIAAQEQLRRSEGQLRTLFGQAHVGIVVATPDQRLVFANPHFTTLTGYALSDLEGLRLPDLIPEATGVGEGFLDAVEQRLVGKDGRVLWVSRSDGPIYDEDGAVSHIGIVLSDITLRRGQETDMRRLAAIIASSDDAIVGTDLDLNVTSWNEGAVRLYGYDAHEIIGKSVLVLIPEDRQEEERQILETVRGGGRLRSHETCRLHRDGRLIEVSLTVSPIVDQAGVVIGASKIARDISERRMAEKMQRVLLGEMKHRVKNILATVHAIARQTFATAPSPEAEAFSARLFALSRAQDLITREARDGVALADLVAGVLEPYQGERFTVDGPPIELAGRAALSFTLGLHELATNAAKYGALSGTAGQVTIRWTLTDGPQPVFTLLWQESGGPPVTAPARRGFGTSLIEQVLAAEIGGQAVMDYAPAGLSMTLRAPLGDWLQHAPLDEAESAPAALFG